MENYLLLRNNVGDYFFPKLKEHFPQIYTPYHISTRFEHEFVSKHGGFFALTPLFIDKWRELLPNIDTVILFDSGYNRYLSKYIKNKKPETRTILFFMNTILEEYQRQWLKDKNIDEFWSYDKKDVDTYKMKYNSTFYYINEVPSSYINWDVVYIGREKNRDTALNAAENILSTLNVRSWIHVVHSEEEFIPYRDYIKKVRESRCILDITQQGQAGLSLRFMESLFLEKKLITNNKAIAGYDFYNKNNIFILNVDDSSKLEKFINSPYDTSVNHYKEFYKFDAWLRRFDREC